MTATPGLDALQDFHRKLGLLLADAEPGLSTWRILLHDTLLEMANYAGEGIVWTKADGMKVRP